MTLASKEKPLSICVFHGKHDYLLRTERLLGTLECPKCKRVQNEKAKTSAKRIINVPWHS